MVRSRALARIVKLPVILERVPVKKIDAAGETQIERAAAARAITGGVQGPALGPLVGSGGNTPAGVHGAEPPETLGFYIF